MKKKIVLTGGGTAGHITPHLALLPHLKKDYDCFYIGSKDGMEKQMISPLMPYYEIETTKLRRSLSLKNLLIPFKLLKGVCEAKRILKKIKPDVIFSKGGFVAVPVVIAGKQLKIPVITHESDYTLGLANKLIYKKCKYICTSFDVTAKNLKNGIYTGSPVRSEILNGNKQNIYKNYAFDSSKKNLLIIGGSLGSQKINQAVFDSIHDLIAKFNILHIVGKGNKNNQINKKGYEQVEFLQNVGDAFDFADVVVTRGGANVLFELLALKKPMLIIPLGKQESRGDQIVNANYFLNHGFANVLIEEDLTPKTLLEQINATLNQANDLRKNMQNGFVDGTRTIVKLINKTVKES